MKLQARDSLKAPEIHSRARTGKWRRTVTLEQQSQHTYHTAAAVPGLVFRSLAHSLGAVQ